MGLSKDLKRKITLMIYDRQCMAQKTGRLICSLKEVEKTLNHFCKKK